MNVDDARLLSLPAYDEDDLEEPLEWLTRLSTTHLRQWLRVAVRTHDALPLDTSRADDFAAYIGQVLACAGEPLTGRLLEVVPTLLQEWHRDDDTCVLDDLLTITGVLRCAAAESDIVRIADQELDDHDDEITLRQACLGTLSGLGCSPRTDWIFKKFISQRPYAALCYHALYCYNPTFAISEISTLLHVYSEDAARSELMDVIRVLFVGRRNEEAIDLLKRFVLEVPVEDGYLEDTLMLLAAIGIEIWLDYKTQLKQRAYLSIRRGDSNVGTETIHLESLDGRRARAIGRVRTRIVSDAASLPDEINPFIQYSAKRPRA